MAVKAVILAGGLGSRLSEETQVRPKPMVEIGGRPILWHILKIYAAHGVNDFIICLGYKGYVIKEYFANYFLHASDVTIDLGSNTTEVHHAQAEPWRVTLVDTGRGLDDRRPPEASRAITSVTRRSASPTATPCRDVDISAVVAHHRAGVAPRRSPLCSRPPRWANAPDGRRRGHRVRREARR